MDTVAVILAAVRPSKRVTIEHTVGKGLAVVAFDADPKRFAECFARAGLRPGDRSGFIVLEALDSSCILRAVHGEEA